MAIKKFPSPPTPSIRSIETSAHPKLCSRLFPFPTFLISRMDLLFSVLRKTRKGSSVTTIKFARPREFVEQQKKVLTESGVKGREKHNSLSALNAETLLISNLSFTFTFFSACRIHPHFFELLWTSPTVKERKTRSFLCSCVLG